jgi:hypothetical protein
MLVPLANCGKGLYDIQNCLYNNLRDIPIMNINFLQNAWSEDQTIGLLLTPLSELNFHSS